MYPHSTEPKGYRCALNAGTREVRAIYQVIDTSDGDAVVDTFRNEVLANRLAATSPSYRVRPFALR